METSHGFIVMWPDLEVSPALLGWGHYTRAPHKRLSWDPEVLYFVTPSELQGTEWSLERVGIKISP